MTSSSPIANFEEDLTDRQVIRPILKHMNWVFKQSPPDWTISLRRLRLTTLNMNSFDEWMVEMNDPPKIKWNADTVRSF
jgi:hypothetical protein